MASWIVLAVVFLLRWTCRKSLSSDPRPLLRANDIPYIYAALHAHQIATLLMSETGTAAMVSRSLDGQVIVPALKSMGVFVVRGSGSKGNSATKGGREALAALVEHVSSGLPGYVAVDGPSGPRGCVHMGIASLAERTGAVVLPIAAIPNRRWIFKRAWDRTQVPLPFSTIHGTFGKPIGIGKNETTESFRIRIEQSLNELERKQDPAEGAYMQSLRSSSKTQVG